MTNRRPDKRKTMIQIAALALAGIMGISVILSAVLH
jgi:hypothetical protein